jgi:hypothetical protein
MTFKQLQWAGIFSGLVSIEVALLFKLIRSPAATDPTWIVVAICMVGALFILSPNLSSLASLSLGKEGLKAELKVLHRKTSHLEQEILRLTMMSMGDLCYRNLLKLASGTFVNFDKPHHRGLESELYHLRNLGYVVHKKDKTPSLFEIPEKGSDLCDYIEVTAEGRRYIELRERYQRRSKAPRRDGAPAPIEPSS